MDVPRRVPLGVDCFFFFGWLTSKWHVPMLSSLILFFGNSNQRDIAADKTSRHQMFNNLDYESKFCKFPYILSPKFRIQYFQEKKINIQNTQLQSPSPSSTPQQQQLAAMTFTLGGVFKTTTCRIPAPLGGMNPLQCRLNLYSLQLGLQPLRPP